MTRKESEKLSSAMNQLRAMQDEDLHRIKAKISSLKRGHRFYDWRQTSDLARDLCTFLADIRADIKDPKTGLSLVEAFYKTDEAVISQCDDSYGNLGDVYSMDARELFEHYGPQCEDKKRVSEIIFDLSLQDPYCVRDTLIKHAGKVLDETQLRALIDRYTAYGAEATEETDQRTAKFAVISLAKQVGDPVIFEKTTLQGVEKPWPALWIDIARQYLSAGDAETAYERIMRISKKDIITEDKRYALLLDIYRQLGWEEKRLELLQQRFQSNRSVSTMKALLEIVGEDRRDKMVAAAVDDIQRSDKFSHEDLQFLLDCVREREAEEYLIRHADEIDGEYYSYWIPVAEALVLTGRTIGASLVYRALLLSILERAYFKAYPYAAKYLIKLDRLARVVAESGKGEPGGEGSEEGEAGTLGVTGECDKAGEAKGIENHQSFMERLLLLHGKKKSFWRMYEEGN